jgi:hypothetical protein
MQMHGCCLFAISLDMSIRKGVHAVVVPTISRRRHWLQMTVKKLFRSIQPSPFELGAQPIRRCLQYDPQLAIDASPELVSGQLPLAHTPPVCPEPMPPVPHRFGHPPEPRGGPRAVSGLHGQGSAAPKSRPRSSPHRRVGRRYRTRGVVSGPPRNSSAHARLGQNPSSVPARGPTATSSHRPVR